MFSTVPAYRVPPVLNWNLNNTWLYCKSLSDDGSFLCVSLRALKLGYLTQDMIDDYEPGLMFTIPRLAIVW